MVTSAIAPAITVTMAMTMASRGRSTKTDDSIASASGRSHRRRSLDRRSGPQRPESLHDHLLAPLESLGNDGVRAGLAPQLHPPDDGFAAFHDEDIDALLVGDQRSLR